MKLKQANNRLWKQSKRLCRQERRAVKLLARIVAPCGEEGCPVGTEDFSELIHYPYAEAHPNTLRRILAVRYSPDNDRLELRLDFTPEDRERNEFPTNEWLPEFLAQPTDYGFLLEEIRNNLEFCNGYQKK